MYVLKIDTRVRPHVTGPLRHSAARYGKCLQLPLKDRDLSHGEGRDAPHDAIFHLPLQGSSQSMVYGTGPRADRFLLQDGYHAIATSGLLYDLVTLPLLTCNAAFPLVEITVVDILVA
jgi:hypothetical protein